MINSKYDNLKLIGVIKLFLLILLSLSYYYLGDNRGFNLSFNYYFPFAISIIFIVLGLLKYKNTKSDDGLKNIYGYALLPELITILFCFILLIFHNVGFSYYKHSVSVALLYLLPILEAISIIYLFKQESIDLLFRASVLSYSFIVIYFVLNNGIIPLFKTIYMQIFDNSNIFTYLEAHEITYTFGLFLIYYLNNSYKNKLKIFLCIFFILLGFKRILALALILVIILKLLFSKINNSFTTRFIIFLIGICAICSSYCWIYMIRDGYFKYNYYNKETYLDTSGFSGRLKLSFELEPIYEFSPFYIGKGIGYVDQYRQENVVSSNLALHNDMLRKYIEYGFLIFGIYMFYKIYYISLKLYDMKGKNNMITYLMMIIMTIICWLTDNNAGFFVFNVVFNTILLNLFYRETEKNEKINNKN